MRRPTGRLRGASAFGSLTAIRSRSGSATIIQDPRQRSHDDQPKHARNETALNPSWRDAPGGLPARVRTQRKAPRGGGWCVPASINELLRHQAGQRVAHQWQRNGNRLSLPRLRPFSATTTLTHASRATTHAEAVQAWSCHAEPLDPGDLASPSLHRIPEVNGALCVHPELRCVRCEERSRTRALSG